MSGSQRCHCPPLFYPRSLHRTIEQDDSDISSESSSDESTAAAGASEQAATDCFNNETSQLIKGSEDVFLSSTAPFTFVDDNASPAHTSNKDDAVGEAVATASVTHSEKMETLLDLISTTPFEVLRELKREASIQTVQHKGPAVQSETASPNNIQIPSTAEASSDNSYINDAILDGLQSTSEKSHHDLIEEFLALQNQTSLSQAQEHAKVIFPLLHLPFPDGFFVNSNLPVLAAVWDTATDVQQACYEIAITSAIPAELKDDRKYLWSYEKLPSELHLNPCADLPDRMEGLQLAMLGQKPEYKWWELIRPALLELRATTGKEFFNYTDIHALIQRRFLYYSCGDVADQALESIKATLRGGHKACFIKHDTFEGRSKRLLFGCDPSIDPRVRVYQDKAPASGDGTGESGETTTTGAKGKRKRKTATPGAQLQDQKVKRRKRETSTLSQQ